MFLTYALQAQNIFSFLRVIFNNFNGDFKFDTSIDTMIRILHTLW
jgi:hypothetical protein